MKEILVNDLIDMYHDFLDENGCVKLGNLEYKPSRILKEIDPIAYIVGFDDYYEFIRDKYHCEFMEIKRKNK